MGSCCGVHKHAPVREASMMAKDPVCGMDVEVNGPHKHVVGSEAFHFCSAHCLKKFRDSPEKYSGKAPATERISEGSHDAIYTCPMHPEILQKGPGSCPKCGMALEPVEASLDEGPSTLR